MKLKIIGDKAFEVDNGYVLVFDNAYRATLYDGPDRECRVGYMRTKWSDHAQLVEAEHYPETGGVLEDEEWTVSTAEDECVMPLCAAQLEAVRWLVEKAEARFRAHA